MLLAMALAAKNQAKKTRWAAVSGGFDPMHIGHVRMFREARLLGDKLVVIINNDNWLRLKKGFVFMPEKERAEMIETFPFVDKVVITDHAPNDPDLSVVRALRKLKPAVFANGGDRFADNIPEAVACRELNIRTVFNVGRGGKVQSSSWMIKGASRNLARSVRPWGEFYQWDRGTDWNLKTVHIKPGHHVRLQYHNRRSEWWMLVDGRARGTIVDRQGRKKTTALKKGEFFRIPKKAPHRLDSKAGATIIEISFGPFDEGDIVRIEETKTHH